MKPSVDGYVVGELLGGGSFGSVYAAVRKLPNRAEFPVALKFLRPLVGSFGHEKFHREADLGLRIGGNHPGLLTVFDLVDAKPTLCLVTERIFGLSVAELIACSAQTGRAVPTRIVRRIFAQALDALAYCHRAGVLHRDISPSNLMLDRIQGRVCLIDLGLATYFERLTCTFTPEGNAPYASLEQLQHQQLDAAADVYSLGATMYTLVAGTPPYGKGSANTKRMRRMEHGPLPEFDGCGFSDDLQQILAGLLVPRAERRYTSALQVLAHLGEDRASTDELAAFVSELIGQPKNHHDAHAPTRKPGQSTQPTQPAGNQTPAAVAAHRYRMRGRWAVGFVIAIAFALWLTRLDWEKSPAPSGLSTAAPPAPSRHEVPVPVLVTPTAPVPHVSPAPSTDEDAAGMPFCPIGPPARSDDVTTERMQRSAATPVAVTTSAAATAAGAPKGQTSRSPRAHKSRQARAAQRPSFVRYSVGPFQ